MGSEQISRPSIGQLDQPQSGLALWVMSRIRKASFGARTLLSNPLFIVFLCLADLVSFLLITGSLHPDIDGQKWVVAIIIGLVWSVEVLACILSSPRVYLQSGLVVNHMISFFGLLVVSDIVKLGIELCLPLTLVKTARAGYFVILRFSSMDSSIRILLNSFCFSLYWQSALALALTIIGTSLGNHFFADNINRYLFLPLFFLVIFPGGFILISYCVLNNILVPLDDFLKALHLAAGTLSSTIRSINGQSTRLSTGSIDGSSLHALTETKPFEVELTHLNRIAERLGSYLAIHTSTPEVHSDIDIAVVKSVGASMHRHDHLPSFANRRSVLPQVVEIQKSSLISLINSWEFNPLHLSVEDQSFAVEALFFHLNHLPFEKDSFRSFYTLVRSKYREENPYHRFEHALDVCQTVHRFLQLTNATSFLRSTDRMGLLIAALVHDIGHLGVNNQFLIETNHELAQRFNDRSPLENYHCYEFFLISNETQLFQKLGPQEVRELRRVIIESVLSTDNACHFAMVKELAVLNEVHAEALHNDRLQVINSPESINLINKLFLHSADISNPTKPFAICREWAMLVMEEFFAQGDLEQATGIPISPLNDRSKVNIPQSQVGFAEFVVAPLYMQQFKLFPEFVDSCQFLIGNMVQWAAEGNEQKLLDRCRKLADTFNSLPGMGGLYVPLSFS